MRWFIFWMFGLSLSGFAGSLWAQSESRIFAAELLQLESRQMLKPTEVLRYSDGEQGVALRKVLSPQRARLIVPAYFQSVNLRKADEPDIAALVKPMLVRYEKAFTVQPREYEEEYLDALNWNVQLILLGSNAKNELPQPSIPNSSNDAMAFKKLLEAANGLLDVMKDLAAKSIRQKVSSGVFSPDGVKRALDYADLLSPQVGSQLPTLEWRSRPLVSGQTVYAAQCVACHASGAAGSPRVGDVNAWQPRLRAGFSALLTSTLKGKGAMGAQSGGDYTDFELARAVVFMTNASGGKFAEPFVPPGLSDTVRFQVRTVQAEVNKVPAVVAYAAMEPAARLRFGETVYQNNCVVCHQIHGKGGGPIPSLLRAPSLERNDLAVAMLLEGSNNRGMPSWKHLDDEKIASVINYIRLTFGVYLVEDVTPNDVLKHR